MMDGQSKHILSLWVYTSNSFFPLHISNNTLHERKKFVFSFLKPNLEVKANKDFLCFPVFSTIFICDALARDWCLKFLSLLFSWKTPKIFISARNNRKV